LTEQTIYFALGCVITALAALAFAPFFWRRALRLTRARLQLQVPLSMQEILAERDQLRAEFAVERLRAEQMVERIRASKTRDMAVIGRERIASAAMADEIAALRRLEQSQEREIRFLMDDLAAAQAEAGALKVELYDAHGLVDRWRAHADRNVGARSALRGELDDKRMLIASLETRIAGLEAQLKAALQAGQAREQGLRGRLEAAVAQSARHETSGVSLRHDLDEARQRIRGLEQELEAALASAREREKNTKLLQSLQTVKARGQDRANSETIEDLRAETEALREVITELRRRTGTMEGDGVSADESLRASIHALGLAVARMAKPETLGPSNGSERERRRLEPTPSPIDAA